MHYKLISCCMKWFIFNMITFLVHVFMCWRQNFAIIILARRIELMVSFSESQWSVRPRISLLEVKWMEWLDVLIDGLDHFLYIYTRGKGCLFLKGHAPSWMAPSWIGSFEKGNRLMTKLINYYRNWSLILISS